MAFRRRFSGSKRRTSKRTRPRWFGQSAELLLTAAAPTGLITLLTATQMAVGVAGLEQEMLLARLVGRITVSTLTGTIVGGGVGIGFLKTANFVVVAGGFNDPLVASELGTRDWLRLCSIQVPPNAGPQAWLWHEDIDIRVKRRLKSEDGICIAADQALGVNSVIITADIRILIEVRI